jgi:hypothetical protein
MASLPSACPQCLHAYTDAAGTHAPAAFPCGHAFCQPCAAAWVRGDNPPTCPLACGAVFAERAVPPPLALPPPPAAAAAPTPPPARAIAAGPEPLRWTPAADEGQVLVLAAPADVRFGVAGKWVLREGCVGELPITNAAFSVPLLGVHRDPAIGVAKHAEVSWRWDTVAVEGERVVLQGCGGAPRTVRYGAPSHAATLWAAASAAPCAWVEHSLAEGEAVAVENATFGGDPAPGVRKVLQLAVPPPPLAIAGVPSALPLGDCALCGDAGVPALTPCGGAPAHAHCLPCALQALRAELEQRGGAVDLTFPVLCAVCKPSVYGGGQAAAAAAAAARTALGRPEEALRGWWLPEAVEAVGAWSVAASEAARLQQHALRPAERSVYQARLVGALARAPPAAEGARSARLGLRDIVFVCPHAECRRPSLLERHESEADVVGGNAAALAEAVVAGGGAEGAAAAEAAAAAAAAPAPLPVHRKGAPGACSCSVVCCARARARVCVCVCAGRAGRTPLRAVLPLPLTPHLTPNPPPPQLPAPTAPPRSALIAGTSGP